MARLDELKLTNDPVGADIDYATLPPQDPNLDHMYEAFEDVACPNAPGMAGEVGASLPVSPSSLISLNHGEPSMMPELNHDTRRVLRACYDYWAAESLPPNERAICYTWIKHRYEDRFGAPLTRAMFDRAMRSGLLVKDDTSRGGHRRYYRLVDPERLRALAESTRN